MKQLLLLITTVIICNLYAEQLFQARTGQTINATISNKDLTRIQVSGFPIIRAFTSAPVTIKKDSSTGQLYILPNDIKNGFNLFIVDKNGDNFNLYLTPSKNHSGDSLVIMPDAASIKKLKSAQQSNIKLNNQNSSYSRNINEIIQLMYLNKDDVSSNGYEVLDINQVIPIWENVQSIILKQYANNLLDGFVYSITNNTSNRILLNEGRFFHRGVLAVAIETPSLEVGETTKVFIVQEHLGE